AERREPALAVDRGVDEEEHLREGAPGLLVERPPRKLADALFREVAVGVVGHLLAADADDREARRQQAVDMQVVERRQQLAMCQVSVAAEDDDGHDFLTAWPPNCWRSAASRRSAKGSSCRERKRV